MSKKVSKPFYWGEKLPGYVKHESRICFGIDFFDSEEASEKAQERCALLTEPTTAAGFTTCYAAETKASITSRKRPGASSMQ